MQPMQQEDLHRLQAFVFDKAVKEVNNRWVAEVDITPFTFTPEEYLKIWDDDRKSSNGYEVWRNFGLTVEVKVMK